MQQPAVITDEGASRLETAEPGEWFSPGRFAVILGALIFVSFPQILLGLQTFVVRDFGFFAYPLAYFQRECFWRGELPLWNPYNDCGVPFLAQWNTMPLYPPSLIYLLLPLPWSLNLFCLLHQFAAGMGMYFLVHRWTGGRFASAVAGVAFAFNGLTLNFLMWPSHIATLSLMPWVVLFVERAWNEGGRRIFLAALIGALQMLAGGPETILLTWLLLGALWVAQAAQIFRASRSGRREEALLSTATTDQMISEPPRVGCYGFRAIFWRLPAVVLLVALLAATQLLPFLDLAAHSQREQGYADTRWSIPGWGWANFLVPMVFGHVWNMGVFFQYDQGWTSSYYLGIGTLLLALLAVWLVRERRVWVLAAAAGLALCLSFGNQNVVYRALRNLLPQISLMTYPVKFVTMVVFIAPLLAGFAVAHLQGLKNSGQSGANRRLLLLGAMMLALIGGILIWAWRWPFPTDDFPVTLRNGLGRAGFVAASVAVLVLCSSRREEAPIFHSALRTPHSALSRASSRRLLQSLARVLPLLLLLVLWLDVWTHEPAQNPGVEPMVYTPDLARAKLAMKPQPELGQSRVMLAPATALKFIQFVISNPRQNFLAKRAGYFADCNLLDHVPKVDGFFSLYPRESGELISTIYGTTNAAFPHLADFLAVSYVTAPGDYINWVARQSWLPPATAGQRPIFLDHSQALSALRRPDFDGRRIVILPPSARTSMAVTNESDAQVNIRSWQNGRVELDVQASKPSLVVVSQSYYHNWRAYVDGRPTELFRANYAFQAVQAPEGHHQVRLAYEDRAFCIGAWISGLSLAACLAALWLSRRFRRP